MTPIDEASCVHAAAAGDHEGGAEDAEDRARGADRERVRVEQQRAEGAGEERGEVEGDEARRADRRLQQPAEEVESNMLKPMWMRPAWRKPPVTSRYHSPSATEGP